MGPAERLRGGAPAGAHHGFVVLVLLVLGQAGQGVALSESQQLVLGAYASRRPVEGGAGVLRLGGERVRVRCGGGDVEPGPGAVEGKRSPGSQRVFASPGQVVLRGVEGWRSVVGATFGGVVAGVLVQFFLQPLQGAVAVDLGFHGCLIRRRQLGQVVEGVGEGSVAAVVSHASADDAATGDADNAGAFTAT